MRLLLFAALVVTSVGADAQRYEQVSSVRVGNRVIAVGDTIEQLRRNRPVSVRGNAYTFADNRRRVTCYVGGNGRCYALRVRPSR